MPSPAKNVAAFVVCLLAAAFVTPFLEFPFLRLAKSMYGLHAETMLEWVASPLFAAILGTIAARTWVAIPARWVWVIPVPIAVLFAMARGLGGNASVWKEFSGTGCGPGARTACVQFFAFTVPALRCACFSAAAAIGGRDPRNPPALETNNPQLSVAEGEGI